MTKKNALKRLGQIKRQKARKRTKGKFTPFNPDDTLSNKISDSTEIEKHLVNNKIIKLPFIQGLNVDILGKRTCRKGSIRQSTQGHGFTNAMALEKVLYDIEKENEFLAIFNVKR